MKNLSTYPPGALFLYSTDNNPDQWGVEFSTRGLQYRDKRIPACGGIFLPYAFELKNARSATTLIFKEHHGNTERCNPKDDPDKIPFHFFIELKTFKQNTNTSVETALDINYILGSASPGEVVAPGLIVRRAFRDPDVGANFDYQRYMKCISILSSD
jgi:hypothetical protein